MPLKCLWVNHCQFSGVFIIQTSFLQILSIITQLSRDRGLHSRVFRCPVRPWVLSFPPAGADTWWTLFSVQWNGTRGQDRYVAIGEEEADSLRCGYRVLEHCTAKSIGSGHTSSPEYYTQAYWLDRRWDLDFCFVALHCLSLWSRCATERWLLGTHFLIYNAQSFDSHVRKASILSNSNFLLESARGMDNINVNPCRIAAIMVCTYS
jgi:hypothetical protein